MADGADLTEELEKALSTGPETGNLERAVALVAFLRKHCPWDEKQTPETLIPHLLEESHEVADAIRRGGPPEVEDELGDLLLNLAFQIAIGEERETFSGGSVWRGLKTKMIRRHPQLFGAESLPWEEAKRREAEHVQQGKSVLDHLSPSPSPLRLAYLIQKRVSRVGFDWNAPQGGLEKVREETDEVARLLEPTTEPVPFVGGERGGQSQPQERREMPLDGGRLEEEVGDLLFSVVNLARLLDVDPIDALSRANQKFVTRFQALERLARDENLPMPGTELEVLDSLWDRVKRLQSSD